MESSITVRYIYDLPAFSGLTLIAGRSGLDNAITNCTNLDYEYEKTVMNKFTHIHFAQGEFILTSFLYAKDNEFFIMDAVKRLSENGCSGLAIRNVFRLPISDYVIRYADSKGFPIFIMKDVCISFEDFIFNIKDLVRAHQNMDWAERYVDRMLRRKLGYQVVIENALELNPSFETEYCVCYFKWKDSLMFHNVQTVFEALNGLLKNSDSLFRYKNGIMLIHTTDIFDLESEQGVAEYYIRTLGDMHGLYYVGVSRIHHLIAEMDEAIEEALYAAIYNAWSQTDFTSYSMLGIYQVILPHVYERRYESYYKSFVTRLEDFDHENNTKLLTTAEQYVLTDGDIELTAQALSQHRNTIRYRLNKISEVCGVNISEKSGYEQFSFAFKSFFARTMMDNDSSLFRVRRLTQTEESSK